MPTPDHVYEEICIRWAHGYEIKCLIDKLKTIDLSNRYDIHECKFLSNDIAHIIRGLILLDASENFK